MKTYNSPMLQVVGISKNDVIATSFGYKNAWNGSTPILAPGERGIYDPYDAGY